MIPDLDYRLRLSRTRNRLHQKDVAERCQIKRGNISSYETGNSAPTLENLVKLAVQYKTSTDYLLGIERQPQLTLEGLTEDQIEALHSVRDAFMRQNNVEHALQEK